MATFSDEVKKIYFLEEMMQNIFEATLIKREGGEAASEIDVTKYCLIIEETCPA